jgi:hypothetical protein
MAPRPSNRWDFVVVLRRYCVFPQIHACRLRPEAMFLCEPLFLRKPVGATNVGSPREFIEKCVARWLELRQSLREAGRKKNSELPSQLYVGEVASQLRRQVSGWR